MRRRSLMLLFAALAAIFVVLAIARLGAAPSAAAQKKHSASPEAWLRGVSDGSTRVVDMTYAINDKLPAWPGDDRTFEAKTVATPEKDGYFARSFWTLEHYGTHLDAPAHFPPGKQYLDQIPVEHFFGPAVVIDVRDDTAKDPDYRLRVMRVEKWEALHGRIPAGAIVLLRTGWSSRWPDQARYRNMDANGVMHFPGYSVEAAKLLIERGAVGLGIDTLSIDYGPSKDFEVHGTDLPAGLYNLENLANLEQLPEAGAFLIAAPIKLEGGSGGPVRVFALLPPSQ
ncbi:MAG: cyclase family protein [Candidatus Acidiferrales bacterium]|jgi:kynurenine formamidase